MPGKSCDGTIENHKLKESKAFCEGRLAKSLTGAPVNPHPENSADGDAWARGVASKFAGEPDGCCAPTGPAVPDS